VTTIFLSQAAQTSSSARANDEKHRTAAATLAERMLNEMNGGINVV